MSSIDCAIIGGTGLYGLMQLAHSQQKQIDTPFGGISADVTVGTWHERTVAFLPRHGGSHSLAPHEINYRANIYAIASLKPKAVIAVNAVGSMHSDMPPAAVVLPDQIVDYTWGREHTFVGALSEVPMHVDFEHPYCQSLRQSIAHADRQSVLAATTGVYGATQGPRLESAAEIARMQNDGCSLVGMTGMPEAGLARELGLSYASLCIVANWAAGFEGAAPITMEMVMANLENGFGAAMQLIENYLKNIESEIS